MAKTATVARAVAQDPRQGEMIDQFSQPLPPIEQQEGEILTADVTTSDGVIEELKYPIPNAEELEAAMREIADRPATTVAEMDTVYSRHLREELEGRYRELRTEIGRLSRLTENAMRAEAAIVNALSALDRDGL